jgi:hypothetical protein
MIESMRLIQINQFKELSSIIKSLEHYLLQLVSIEKKHKFAFEWMKPIWMIIISNCLTISYYICTGQISNAEQKIERGKMVCFKNLFISKDDSKEIQTVVQFHQFWL